MQSRVEANKRNEALLKQNQDLTMQMKQMKQEIDDLKLSTLSKVALVLTRRTAVRLAAYSRCSSRLPRFVRVIPGFVVEFMLNLRLDTTPT